MNQKYQSKDYALFSALHAAGFIAVESEIDSFEYALNKSGWKIVPACGEDEIYNIVTQINEIKNSLNVYIGLNGDNENWLRFCLTCAMDLWQRYDKLLGNE